jgi:hypothetical protein
MAKNIELLIGIQDEVIKCRRLADKIVTQGLPVGFANWPTRLRAEPAK